MYSRHLLWILAVLLLSTPSFPTVAQTNPTWSDWELVSPEGEEFSVLMPRNPSTETAKLPYHKMELTTRLYLSSLPNGPVVAIASFNGIRANAFSDLERLNSYVDAFRGWFPAKVKGKDAVAKMTLVGNRLFHGYAGREYKMTVGDLSGVVHTYPTRKRFYAIVVLNTKQDDALQEKFLSSFVLPDKPADQRTGTTSENNATQTEESPNTPTKPGGETKRSEGDVAGSAQIRGGEDNSESGTQPAASSNSNNASKRPLAGGMLNSKAIYLPLPEVPPGEAAGVVMVQVLIDEMGSVIEARAISGPPHLQAAAVNAARLARFTPTMLMGEAVKVTGTLSYSFVRPN